MSVGKRNIGRNVRRNAEGETTGLDSSGSP